MARFPRVQTESREVNQLQFNIAKLLEPLANLLPAAGQLLGTITSDNAAVGNVGEYVSSSNTAGTALVSNTDVALANVTLTPGDWNITGIAGWTNTGAANTIGTDPFLRLYITTTSVGGTSTNGVNTVGGTGIYAKSGFSAATLTIPDMRVTVASGATATYYLNFIVYIGGGGALNGTNLGTGILSARRMR